MRIGCWAGDAVVSVKRAAAADVPVPCIAKAVDGSGLIVRGGAVEGDVSIEHDAVRRAERMWTCAVAMELRVSPETQSDNREQT